MHADLDVYTRFHYASLSLSLSPYLLKQQQCDSLCCINPVNVNTENSVAGVFTRGGNALRFAARSLASFGSASAR